MTKEELLELLKKGEASLLDSEGNDVSKKLENPEESEEILSEKVDLKKLRKLFDNNQDSK